MLQCQTVLGSLGDIYNPNHPPPQPQDPQPTKDEHTCRNTVSLKAGYLNHDGECSILAIEYLQKLHAQKYGPNIPMPPIDNDTRVRLLWHYPSLNIIEQTTHRVLKQITIPVIFVLNDSAAPLMRLWYHEQQQRLQAGTCPVQEEGDDEMNLRDWSVSSMSSSRGDASSPASPPSSVDEDDDWKETRPPQDMSYCATPRQHEMELDDSEFRDTPKQEARPYWEWSQKEQIFFHREQDGSITLFPEITSFPELD